eukprot:TRINITY_DN11453_c0_g1_i1.p1 TRINITY_DN11453_c0_g1~~TRINITY_DN11453_c0_g1_i1.p1  ORF type:complete len:255 (-),score=36.87 TRINITY_DN11453_c0_g1_i1:22-786(-)
MRRSRTCLYAKLAGSLRSTVTSSVFSSYYLSSRNHNSGPREHGVPYLLHGNQNWIDNVKQSDPDFFKNLSRSQTPEYLWIGCSDSRVPAEAVTNTTAGEIFVHRNIANMVVHTDSNLLAVLQYAVDHLKVSNVIVCGHYGCGGVAASMTNKQFGMVDNWLRNIKDVYRFHIDELDGIEDHQKRFDRLVELNVIEQVNNLSRTSIIEKAWAQGRKLSVHGLVYSLRDGKLKDLNRTISSYEEAPKIIAKNKEYPL